MSNIGNKEVFAQNLKYYSDRSGKNQKELAEIAGVAPSTFNDWMKAKKYPRIDKIEILADYFRILKSDLIEKKEKPTEDSGLSINKQKLMQFVETVPDDKVELVLRVMKSMLEAD